MVHAADLRGLMSRIRRWGVVSQEWLRSHEKYGDRADPSTRLNLDLFERVIDVLEHESGKREGLVPSLSEVEPAVASRTGLVRTGGQTTLEDLYSYWVQKRQRRKKPLLRRFWPSTDANNPDPHATFRVRERERYRLRRTRRSDDNEAYRRLAIIRSNVLQALELAQLTQQRERAKLELARIAADSFEQAVFEATDTTGTQRRPLVLQNRAFEARAASAAASRQRNRNRNKSKRRETATKSSAATTAAQQLYSAAMDGMMPRKHAERAALSQGKPAATAALEAEAAERGQIPLPFRCGPWRAPFFVPVHPAAGMAFSRWPLAPVAGDPDAARVKPDDGEIEDVATAATLLAAAPNGAPAACSLQTLQSHSGAAARPPPHSLSLLAASRLDKRSVESLRDRGADLPMGVGGTGAGEAEGDVLALGMASGLSPGFERDETLVADSALGRSTSSEAWLQRRKSALHVDTTARLRALMLQHRTMSAKTPVGIASAGAGWEDSAGMVSGIGSLGPHGEGWELAGRAPQIRTPELTEAREWTVAREDLKAAKLDARPVLKILARSGTGGDDWEEEEEQCYRSLGEAPEASRRLASETTRYVREACRDEAGTGGWRAALAAAAARPPPDFVTRARIGRGGRVWVDRLAAEKGSQLARWRRAGASDIAARDLLQAQEEDSIASHGGAAAVALAAARAAGWERPRTAQLASAAWHSGMHPRRGDDRDEVGGLRSGLEAEEPGMLHSLTAIALGPSHHGSSSSMTFEQTVRSRLLDEAGAPQVGGTTAGVGHRAFTGPAQVVGAPSMDSRGRLYTHRLQGSSGLSRTAPDLAPTVLPSVLLASRGAELNPTGWPWLGAALAEVGGATHLLSREHTSHTGLLGQTIAPKDVTQPGKPVRARRLEAVYATEDGSDEGLVDAMTASRLEALTGRGVSNAGETNSFAPPPVAVGEAGRDSARPSLEDDAFWSHAVRGARPQTLYEQSVLLSKASEVS
jgi:hypothetical protein